MQVERRQALIFAAPLPQRHHAFPAQPAVEFFLVLPKPGSHPRQRRAQKAAQHEHDENSRRVPAQVVQKEFSGRAHGRPGAEAESGHRPLIGEARAGD